MIAAPAVDLRSGRCVQLVGGKPEEERVSLPDPIAVAQRWWDMGYETLHLVDLDAALGSGDNLDVLRQLLACTPATTQVGGGIRNDERAEALVDAGADRIVVGTRALDDPEWLGSLATRYPNTVMVAADTRDGMVLRKGWTESSQLRITDYLERLADLPLAGVLATDVGQEGRLAGIDRPSVAETLRASTLPLWASGGVTTEDDLAFLDEAGAAGAVLGMALYTETLNPEVIARRWGQDASRRTQ
jgi:phosphoribosylformimino-5-aminoimidazole carboxamide ribotide isomerase